MKLILSILFFISLNTNAKTYYVSNYGKDSNEGTSKGSPWLTLSRVNSYTFLPGDTILFKNGDIWYGELIISRHNLYFGGYGPSGKPIITGFTKVSKWIPIGGSIWESSKEISTLNNCNMVVIKGVNTEMGRYPNKGYKKIVSSIASSDLIDTTLSETLDLRGAQLVMRITRFAISKDSIYSQNSDTLKGNFSYPPQAGWGYFIQNSLATLDTLDEWYYNPLTHKLYIYSWVEPTLVKAASIDTLVKINANNITINGVALAGSNKITISNIGNNNTVENCNINYSGSMGIYIGSVSPNFTANNDSIYDSNDVALMNDTSWNFTAANNVIHNSGVYAGMGTRYFNNRSTDLVTWSVKQGIRSVGAYAIIIGNKLDSIGYIPIFYYGDSVLIKNNYINTYCFVMDDGGGIYSYSEFAMRHWKTRNVINNIVLNGIGTADGTPSPPGYTNQAYGIYCDASNGYYNIIGNTIYNANGGIFLNNAYNTYIYGNTLYNNRFNFSVSNYNAAIPMVNITFSNNICIEYPDSAFLFPNNYENIYWQLLPDSVVGKKLPVTFRADSNYYFNDKIAVIQNYVGNYQTISKWKSYSGQEKNSLFAISSLSRISLFFYYNPTLTDSTFYLKQKLFDINGDIYYWSFSILPFESKILFGSILKKQ